MIYSAGFLYKSSMYKSYSVIHSFKKTLHLCKSESITRVDLVVHSILPSPGCVHKQLHCICNYLDMCVRVGVRDEAYVIWNWWKKPQVWVFRHKNDPKLM